MRFVQAADAPAAADWSAYGRSNAATRYSPLQQINRTNVANLERAWIYRTGDMPMEGTRKWGAETTPLKIGDAIYLCSAMNKLIALDAASGKEIWRHDLSRRHHPSVTSSARSATKAPRPAVIIQSGLTCGASASLG